MAPRTTMPLTIGVFLMAAGAAQVAAQTRVARPDNPRVRLSDSRELQFSYSGTSEAPRPRVSRATRHAHTVAFVNPGRGSRPNHSKNSSRPRL